MQSKFRFVRVCMSTLISVALYSSAASDALDECSPRCWNPVQRNSHVNGGIKQNGVANVERCKALCVNDGTCIGVDWKADCNSCWFHMKQSTINDHQEIDHWSLANDTDDCVSYCWRPVKPDVHVEGGYRQPNITDENHCKLFCSETPCCTGLDWVENTCYLLYTAEPLKRYHGVRHWGIKRNLPTSCQSSTSPTVSTTSNTVATLQSSTKPVEERIIGRSDNLIAGIVVLAVLLGLGILIIIGFVINTIRNRRQLHLKSDIRNVELDVNYERLQRAATNVSAGDGIYMNIEGRPN